MSNNEMRKLMVERIEDLATSEGLKRIKFHSGSETYKKSFSRFLRENSREINDIENPEEIAEAMKGLISKFSPELDALAKLLPVYVDACEILNSKS